jgi:4'-phosphopantetheinyl transferase
MQENPGNWPWPEALPGGCLASQEIAVWWADLRQSPQQLAVLKQTLSAAEQERAERFRFPEHQHRFIAARGLLRQLLGAYLDRPAATLCFEQGLHGKPVLAGADANAGLHFNLSHSADQVLYALAWQDVGVDLESHDRTLQFIAISDRICTARELAILHAWPSALQRHAFFTCWTRKEAAAKAVGGGLASGLQNLEVCLGTNLAADGRASLGEGAAQQWGVANLSLPPHWSGAVAARGLDWRWRGWRWQRDHPVGEEEWHGT